MKITGVKIKTDNSKKIMQEVNDRINVALEICGERAVTHSIDNITSQKAVDTGNLRNSMTHKLDAQEHTVYIGSTLKNPAYGIYVELGTGIYTSGGRRTSWVYQDINGDWHKTNGMKPRPFLKPALEDNVSEYQDIIKEELSSLQ